MDGYDQFQPFLLESSTTQELDHCNEEIKDLERKKEDTGDDLQQFEGPRSIYEVYRLCLIFHRKPFKN